MLGEKITRLLRCLNFWSKYTTNQTLIFFFQVWNIRIQYSKTITRSFSKVSSISHQGLWKVSTRSQEGVRKWLDSFRVLCPRVANSQLTFYWEYSQTFFRETTASNLFFIIISIKFVECAEQSRLSSVNILEAGCDFSVLHAQSHSCVLQDFQYLFYLFTKISKQIRMHELNFLRYVFIQDDQLFFFTIWMSFFFLRF